MCDYAEFINIEFNGVSLKMINVCIVCVFLHLIEGLEGVGLKKKFFHHKRSGYKIH